QRMHYVREGEGAPLLFVHGNPTWSFYWRNLLQRYRDSHQVISIDHIGSGLSDKPAQYDYSLAQHAANLRQFVEAHDLRDITVFVHDWGGAIGLKVAAACPERFRRIVLFNTGAFPPPRVPRRIAVCRTPILGRWMIRGGNVFSRAAMRMATHQGLDPAVQAGLIAPYDSWQNRRGVWGFISDIPLTRRHPTYATLVQLEKDLPRLANLPSLAIWGMQDWCFDQVCLQRFVEVWPQLEVHRQPDAGHWVVEDAHAQLGTLLDPFLGVAADRKCPTHA
ncbi:MAG: alpha/beta fold hydrolase, partial [Planctomycetota bacterium]